MSKEEHRFFFSSDHVSLYNNRASFTVNLPFSLDLRGKWKCALLDLFIRLGELDIDSCYILADFCDTSLVQETNQLPILKKLYLKRGESYYTFLRPLYIPIKQTHISSFTLTLLDSNLQEFLISDTKLLIECTIHFYKHGR